MVQGRGAPKDDPEPTDGFIGLDDDVLGLGLKLLETHLSDFDIIE